MENDITFWFWILASGTLGALVIPFVKQYTITKNSLWIILSLLAYCFLIYAYTIVLNSRDIAVIYPLLKIISILFVVFVSIFIFQNSINTETIIGIILAIISISILAKQI
jgi:multidrug transporter EmrE-like cation transporter